MSHSASMAASTERLSRSVNSFTLPATLPAVLLANPWGLRDQLLPGWSYWTVPSRDTAAESPPPPIPADPSTSSVSR